MPMEPTIEKIARKTGRKVNECKCNYCRARCKHPCLGTPDDIINIIKAGHSERIAITEWGAGVVMGILKEPVTILAPLLDTEKGCCTFFNKGLCELHASGLKPTEGKLSSHLVQTDNYIPQKSISWNVVKEWLAITEDQVRELTEIYK